MTISSLPMGERPRERLLRMGAGSLSLQELLAVILRTGRKGTDVMEMATEVLREYPDERALSRATLPELRSFTGMGEAKAAAILAAVELGRRSWCECAGETGGTPWQSALKSLEKEMVREEREFILALFADREGRLLGTERISFGGLDGAFLDAPFLCRRAVRIGAEGVALVHNHPDGNATPSEEDRSLTAAFARQLKLLRVEFLGHFVVAGGKTCPVCVH